MFLCNPEAPAEGLHLSKARGEGGEGPRSKFTPKIFLFHWLHIEVAQLMRIEMKSKTPYFVVKMRLTFFSRIWTWTHYIWNFFEVNNI